MTVPPTLHTKKLWSEKRARVQATDNTLTTPVKHKKKGEEFKRNTNNPMKSTDNKR